jgi:hypothetical protein
MVNHKMIVILHLTEGMIFFQYQLIMNDHVT